MNVTIDPNDLTRHTSLIDHLQTSWTGKVTEHLGLIQRLLGSEDPQFIDALNALALCWFRHQMGLTRGADGQFGSPRDTIGDPLFARYKAIFTEHCNRFHKDGLATHLGYDEDTDLVSLNPDDLSARVLEVLPQAAIEVDLVQRTGRHLLDILSRKISFLEAVSPRNDTTMLEALYYGSGSASLGNVIFGGVFEAIAEANGGKMKVLEIGAGTGGATASISHLINDHCDDYWFTDVSQVFLATARRRFPRLNLSYHIHDANKPEAFAEIADEQFDLVIGANSVHTVARLRETLSYINRVLRPGGVMALLESDRIPNWTEFIFGTAPEWWAAIDGQDRSLGPLSSDSQWAEMLNENIGPNFRCVTRDFLPFLDHFYFDFLPQVYVATKSVELSPIPVPEPQDQPAEHPQGMAEAAPTFETEQAPTPEPEPKSEPEPEPEPEAPLAHRLLVRTELDAGDTALNVVNTADFSGEMTLPIDANSTNMEKLVTGLGTEPQQIVICLSHAEQAAALCSGAAFDPRLSQQWYAVLAFMRAIVEQRDVPHQVTLLTVGGTPVGTENSNIALSPYKGIFLSFYAEYPNALVRHFDLDADSAPANSGALIDGLLSRPFVPEERIVRGDALLEPVIRQTSLIQPERARATSLFPIKRKPKAKAEVQHYEMRIGKLRSFDHMRFDALPDAQPGPGQVKVDIHFTALNYRDVMKVLGEYPLDGGDYMDLGDESSGVVTAVGDDVDPALVGQRVLLVGNSLLSSQKIVSQDQILPFPGDVHMNAAATLPVAYLTAHYGLVNRAQIRKGDRVLIHAAAGGVGLAAIKVAKAKGATVYATASYPKQDTVRHWGADYIYDSRSTAFEEDIMRDTAGQGVDIVLNSLSGEFQSASYRLLRPFGRFVEIGKRDIYEHKPIDQYQLKSNVSVHVVDMSELSREHPDIWKELADDLISHMKTGDYRPIPFRMYRASHIAQAMRTMASGRHLGKILISMQDPVIVPQPGVNKHRGPLHQRVAFVFGGASGVGLEISRTYAKAAIHKLVVVGRSGPQSQPVQDMLAEFEGYQLRSMVYESCDVTDPAQVQDLFDRHYDTDSRNVDVFLASGVYADQPIKSIDYDSFARVIGPKVIGALNIQNALANREPAAFCMLSSVSSMLGNSGQCSYSAANAFLDGLASWRALKSRPGTSINFGPFADTGFLKDKPEVRAVIERMGVHFVPRYFAIKAIQNATTMGVAQVGFFDFDWQKFLQNAHFDEIPEKLRFVIDKNAAGKDAKKSGIDIMKELAAAPADKRHGLIVRYVIEIVSDILATDPKMIDPKLDLSNQGLDSLSTVELGLSIQGDMKLDMQPEDLGNARDPNAIADVLLQKYYATHGGGS